MPAAHLARILMVEDNEADSLLLRHALEHASPEPFGSYHVEVVTRLESAREHLAANDVDLILLDLQLPDSTGIETVAAVRDAAGEVPIVVLTVRKDELLAIRCIEAGAQDFLCKGDFQLWTIRRAISFALARRDSLHRELETTLARYSELIEPPAGSAIESGVATAAKILPIRGPQPEQMQSAKPRYSALFHAYLNHLSHGGPKPRVAMEALIAELGGFQARSGDLILLHLGVLDEALRGLDTDRQRALAMEGRLLVLEMMGILCDSYRDRSTVSSVVESVA